MDVLDRIQSLLPRSRVNIFTCKVIAVPETFYRGGNLLVTLVVV